MGSLGGRTLKIWLVFHRLLWVDHEETGHNRRAATEQKQLIKDSGQTPFKTPKTRDSD